MENISNFTVFLIVVAIFVSSFVGFVIARAVYSIEVDCSNYEKKNESEVEEDVNKFVPIMAYFDGVPYDFDGVPINTEVQL